MIMLAQPDDQSFPQKAIPHGKLISVSLPLTELQQYGLVKQLLNHQGPGSIFVLGHLNSTLPLLFAAVEFSREMTECGEVCRTVILAQKLTEEFAFHQVGRVMSAYCLNREAPAFLDWIAPRLGSAVTCEMMPRCAGIQWELLDSDPKLRLITSAGARQIATCALLSRQGSTPR